MNFTSGCVDSAQVRTVLGTPAPKVYAWNSKAEDSAVGAEYIIMEKLPGISLDLVWPSLEIGDRFKIVKAIASYQRAWMSSSFNHYGSLYYAKDLAGQAQSALYTNVDGLATMDSRFAFGPSTGREYNDDGRATVEFDRGPCEH